MNQYWKGVIYELRHDEDGIRGYSVAELAEGYQRLGLRRYPRASDGSETVWDDIVTGFLDRERKTNGSGDRHRGIQYDQQSAVAKNESSQDDSFTFSENARDDAFQFSENAPHTISEDRIENIPASSVIPVNDITDRENTITLSHSLRNLGIPEDGLSLSRTRTTGMLLLLGRTEYWRLRRQE